MKLSIVIIYLLERSNRNQGVPRLRGPRETSTAFEVIVSDNGSSDHSLAYIRSQHPTVRIVENRTNIGFARGNNAGIQVARGKYV